MVFGLPGCIKCLVYFINSKAVAVETRIFCDLVCISSSFLSIIAHSYKMNKPYKRKTLAKHSDKRHVNEDWKDDFMFFGGPNENRNMWFVGLHYETIRGSNAVGIICSNPKMK
jgi:hypothetical protein